MSYKKTHFSKGWLSVPGYRDWLQEVPNDIFSAGCKYCKSVFSLSNMGKQALTSHMRGKKHRKVVKNMKSCNTLKPTSVSTGENLPNAKSSTEISSPCFASSSSTTDNTRTISTTEPAKSGLKSYILTEEVSKAEIIWCLHVAAEHITFRSAERTLSAFRLMCEDSQLLPKIQLQRTKLGYTIVHGLAPFFKNELIIQLQNVNHFVACFDESLNKISTKQQMDVSLRFWDTESSQVKSRYLTSVFLGHTTAVDILNGFKTALQEINLKKLIQVSMDGPNVNFRFLKDLKEELNTSPSDAVLLDIGSCGLHTMHCAFKTAVLATKWDLISYLRALYNLFKDVPARRADYISYTGSDLFPKKFCAIRWAENIQVVKRAVEMHDNLKKYMLEAEKEKKQPSCKSYSIVKSHMKDNLLLSKLSFFESLANVVEPFLIEFQTDAPQAPFLFESLQSILRSVMNRFLRKDVLRSAATVSSVDIFDSSNLKQAKEVDVGYSVRIALKKSKASPAEIDQFMKSCRTALQIFVQKLTDRSPVKFRLTKGISCLDPAIASNREIATDRLSLCLETLVSQNWFTGIEADKVDYQFKSIIENQSVIELMKSYDRKTRLDTFWMTIVENNLECNELKTFLRFVLILSHGNATVERGFSINKDCLVYNQTEESLIALRRVHDTVISAGGISSVNITKKLIHAARNASAFYKEALKNKEEKEKSTNLIESEKRKSAGKIKELQIKKMSLLAETDKKISLIDEEIKSLKK